MCWDIVPCFRTKLNTLWLLPSPQHEAVFGTRGQLIYLEYLLCSNTYSVLNTFRYEIQWENSK